MAKFKCKNCKNEFESEKYIKYCSEKCSFQSRGYLIDTETGCWNWLGRKHKSGYGVFWFNQKHILAHRFSCEAFHGPAPEGKNHTLHGCDNPACINPDHLRWGSQQENMDDKIERNRQLKGEKHGAAKLKNSEVIDIKAKLKSYVRGDYTKLAKEYSVDINTIKAIHNGLNWSHI